MAFIPHQPMLCGEKEDEDDLAHILLELCPRDHAEAAAHAAAEVAERPAAK